MDRMLAVLETGVLPPDDKSVTHRTSSRRVGVAPFSDSAASQRFASNRSGGGGGGGDGPHLFAVAVLFGVATAATGASALFCLRRAARQSRL